MLIFDFLEKGLGIVSLSFFVYDFSKKNKKKMLHSSNWADIAWLPLFLD